MTKQLSFSLIVPTYNAGERWQAWIVAYQQQTRKADKVVVIDSSSTDNTASLAEAAGFDVHQIPQQDFSHGGTRNLATTYCQESEILIFLTQDAILATPDSLEKLITVFSQQTVAAACGRQLPHTDAILLAKHARLFNYPLQPMLKSRQDIAKLGIKTVFMSNAFAAYRRSVFDEMDGFHPHLILSEDMELAARMVLADYKIAYCSDACVYHSHNYSIREELQRYFDIGVFQAEQPWIQQSFGKATAEGKKFVLSEVRFLLKNAPWLLPRAFVATFAKWLGFKLGLNHQRLPKHWRRKLSMYKNYWHLIDPERSNG